ncbi:MAG TPA: NfeD family protein, partial [Pyrinomonadaceae bacterium]
MFTLAVSLLILSAPAVALLAYVVHASGEKKKSSRRPLSLVGRVGSVERTLNPEGFVLVGGELWRARLRGGGRVASGASHVRVVG